MNHFALPSFCRRFGWRAGKGPIFELDTKDPANDLEFTPNIDDAPGWRGFIMGYDGVNAIIVPEPSTIALSLIGASALLCLRCRKQSLIQNARKMKTRAISLGFGWLVLLSANLLADGTLSFSNFGAPPERRIYDTSLSFPCAGPNYHIALYWGPAGVADDRNLTQIGPSTTFLSGQAAGMFSAGARRIVSAAAGPVLSFQVRVWTGASQSFEEAIATDPNAKFGAGPMFELKTQDPDNALELRPDLDDAPGWRGFILEGGGITTIIVPEPSTIALSLLGASALLCLRCRR